MGPILGNLTYPDGMTEIFHGDQTRVREIFRVDSPLTQAVGHGEQHYVLMFIPFDTELANSATHIRPTTSASEVKVKVKLAHLI